MLTPCQHASSKKARVAALGAHGERIADSLVGRAANELHASFVRNETLTRSVVAKPRPNVARRLIRVASLQASNPPTVLVVDLPRPRLAVLDDAPRVGAHLTFSALA